jgi:hypothetical protein
MNKNDILKISRIERKDDNIYKYALNKETNTEFIISIINEKRNELKTINENKLLHSFYNPETEKYEASQ